MPSRVGLLNDSHLTLFMHRAKDMVNSKTPSSGSSSRSIHKTRQAGVSERGEGGEEKWILIFPNDFF